MAAYLFSGAVKHLYTAFLFTKSDIKTTVIPVTVLALASSPRLAVRNIPHIVFWVWIHVLQFDVSNQTLKPEEDQFNKADRPLPSGRISLRSAIVLRWALVPVCWTLSCMYSVETFWASLALVALTVIYNELSAHCRHWMVRNVVNSMGFAAFELGSMLVATVDHAYLDRIAVLSVGLSACIFASTIHAQDFKDIYGDRMVGRRTIPIVLPHIARYTVVVGLVVWSMCLAYIWHVRRDISILFIGLALYVGYRFVMMTTIHDDQVSFYWYNVWLSIAHILPGYYRIYATTQ